jgi:hypothetical protein
MNNLFETKRIERLLARAQKAWQVQDWQIEWQFGECECEGDIELRFTEKTALITLDKSHIPSYTILARTIYHEVGHTVMVIMERNMSDFVDHYIKNKKTRDVFWERVNTDQNVIIDHIITRIFQI